MVYGKIARLVPVVLSGALLFTGCAMMPPEGYSESTVRIFGAHSAYYIDFTAQSDKDGYLVQGTAHLGSDCDSSIVEIKADEETTAKVTGFADCKRGSLRLVYTAPDGTQTVLVECEDGSYETFDVSLAVTEEEGVLELNGSGGYEVCAFEIKIAGEHISLGGSAAVGESTISELPEEPEIPEELELPEIPEAPDTPELPKEPVPSKLSEESGMSELPELSR